jgi:hypothetical protein
MNDRTVNFQLVKMDGDFVPRSQWWNLPRKLMNKIRGIQEMPANPINHPACAEILEGGSHADLRVVYRRD